MKAILTAAMIAALATPVMAGGPVDAPVEAPVEVAPAPASSAGGVLIPLLAIAVLAVALSDN